MKIKRLLFLIKRLENNKLTFIISMTIFAFSSIVNLYATYITATIVDQGIAKRDIYVISKYAILLLTAQVLTILLGTLGLYISENAAHNILSNYKSNIMTRLFRCSVKQYYDYGETQIRTMLSSTIDNLKFFFADLPRVFAELAILIIGSMVYVGSVDSMIVFMILGIIMMNSAIYLITKKALILISDKKLQLNKKWTEFLLSICRDIDEYVINAGKYNLFRVVDVKYSELCRLDIKNKRILVASSFLSNIMTQILTLGVYVLLRNRVSIGIILATITFTGIIFPLIQTCFEMVNYCTNLQPCIDEAMEMEKMLFTEENMIAYEHMDSDMFYVKGLCFEYGEKEIFKDLNIRLERKGLYVCNDHNGAGKTTFLRALLQSYPVKNGSTNITEDKYECLLQKNTILPGSILFNITLEETGTVDEERIDNIFSMLNFTNVIEKLPDKLMTQVDFSENGFSGGELRKICLTRTLYRGVDKQIWILDEPDAGMDEETVKRLGNYLIEMAQNKLIIMVTHNGYLSTLGTKLALAGVNKL